MKPPVQHSKIEHNSVLRNLNPLFAAGQAVGLKTASVRMIILTSYIMSLVILAGYSASLISSLAVERRHLPFRDFYTTVPTSWVSWATLPPSIYLTYVADTHQITG